VRGAIEDVIDYTRRRMRNRIAQLRPGEYRFTDYGSQTYTFFTNAGIPAGIDSFTFDVEQQTHTAYLGLSYLFNWAGR